MMKMAGRGPSHHKMKCTPPAPTGWTWYVTQMVGRVTYQCPEYIGQLLGHTIHDCSPTGCDGPRGGASFIHFWKSTKLRGIAPVG